MKILMLLEQTFPPDSRVEKEMVSLATEKHKIFLACVTHDKLKQGIEKKEHYTIYRKYFPKKIFDKLRVTHLISPFMLLWWRIFIHKVYKEVKFEAIHVHDLPLSKVGYFFKKKYGVRFICDQHEYYSDWITKTSYMNTTIGKIILTFSDWKKYEKKYLSHADLCITVAEPLRRNYINKYGLRDESIITIPNTPAKAVYKLENVFNDIIEKYSNDFVIFYAGGLDNLRGIDTAIQSLTILRDKIVNIKLVLAGRLTKDYSPITTAKEYDVEDLVSYIGWIEESQLPSYITASKICFFTPPSNRDEINKTIATKIYQYTIMKKPIIVSDAKMMKDFVEQNNLGISIESGNYTQFADAVLKIYTSPNAFTGKNTETEWYWEETSKPLIAKYGLFSIKK